MIAMELAHQDEVNKMLRKPGETEAFTASVVRESSVVADRRRFERALRTHCGSTDWQKDGRRSQV